MSVKFIGKGLLALDHYAEGFMKNMEEAVKALPEEFAEFQVNPPLYVAAFYVFHALELFDKDLEALGKKLEDKKLTDAEREKFMAVADLRTAQNLKCMAIADAMKEVLTAHTQNKGTYGPATDH